MYLKLENLARLLHCRVVVDFELRLQIRNANETASANWASYWTTAQILSSRSGSCWLVLQPQGLPYTVSLLRTTKLVCRVNLLICHGEPSGGLFALYFLLSLKAFSVISGFVFCCRGCSTCYVVVDSH